MTAIRIATLLVAVTMLAAIIGGFAAGDFGAEGRQILDMAWGRVTLIDLYAGLLLFAGWVWLRERSAIVVPWFIGLVVLGNLAAGIYAFSAAMRSETVSEFLAGRHD